MNKIKTIFVGTPEFATHYLKALLDDGRFDVVGVITQSDKPSGRKQELLPSPVKKIALDSGIKIFQPEALKGNSEIIDELQKLNADLMIVVAYGQIIPQDILDIFKSGVINVHPSMLPKYRGASPVQSVILAGEKKTGVTIMLMDAKMDHGPILSQIEMELSGVETSDVLHDKLAEASTGLLIDTVIGYIGGEIKPVEQDHTQATFCKTITRDDAKIDWNKTAQEIKNKINAFHSWPGTWTTLDSKRLKIFPPVEITTKQANKKIGEIFVDNDFAVACGDGGLKIKNLQLEGKNKVSVEEFMRGYKDLNNQFVL